MQTQNNPCIYAHAKRFNRPILMNCFYAPALTACVQNQVIHTILISHSILKNPNVAFEANFTHLH